MTTELIQLTNDAKAEGGVTGISVVPTAASGTSVMRAVEPRPTPLTTFIVSQRWTLWILFGRQLVVIISIIIVAPFPNIAMHIVQTKRVGLFQTVWARQKAAFHIRFQLGMPMNIS